jgi:hypothetical protein
VLVSVVVVATVVFLPIQIYFIHYRWEASRQAQKEIPHEMNIKRDTVRERERETGTQEEILITKLPKTKKRKWTYIKELQDCIHIFINFSKTKKKQPHETEMSICFVRTPKVKKKNKKNLWSFQAIRFKSQSTDTLLMGFLSLSLSHSIFLGLLVHVHKF